MADKITWRNEQRKLSDLIPWADNPRQITKEQGKRLTASLRKFGYSQPIEIEPDNLILDGHQRDFLMQTMSEYTKDTLLDVRVSSRKFTDAERREYVLYKGQGASGEWNMDLISSWDPKELVEWGGFTDAQMGGFGQNLQFDEFDGEGDGGGSRLQNGDKVRIVIGALIFDIEDKNHSLYGMTKKADADKVQAQLLDLIARGDLL